MKDEEDEVDSGTEKPAKVDNNRLETSHYSVRTLVFKECSFLL